MVPYVLPLRVALNIADKVFTTHLHWSKTTKGKHAAGHTLNVNKSGCARAGVVLGPFREAWHTLDQSI